MRMPGVCICSHAYKLNKKGCCFLSHQRSHHLSHKRDKETSFPIFVGLKIHAKTRKRRIVDVLFILGVFVWAFPTQVLTIWPEHCCANKHAKKEKKKHVHNSCGRQHRPILHNSNCLFSRYKCVRGSADGKWGRKAGAVRICRYKHKEINVHKEKMSSLTMEVEAVTHASAGLPQDVTVKRAIIIRVNELATESEKWNVKPRLECVSGWNLPSKTPVGVLPWTCRIEEKWPSRQTGGQSNPHKWLVSRKIWSVGELETLPAGTKPRTSHQEEIGAEREALDDLPWKDKRGPSWIRRSQTI